MPNYQGGKLRCNYHWGAGSDLNIRAEIYGAAAARISIAIAAIFALITLQILFLRCLSRERALLGSNFENQLLAWFTSSRFCLFSTLDPLTHRAHTQKSHSTGFNLFVRTDGVMCCFSSKYVFSQVRRFFDWGPGPILLYRTIVGRIIYRKARDHTHTQKKVTWASDWLSLLVGALHLFFLPGDFFYISV